MKALQQIASSILATIIAYEAHQQQPALQKWLVTAAVRWLPIEQQARFAEEWASHLEEVPGVYLKTLHAAGFSFAAVRIHAEERSAKYVRQFAFWLTLATKIVRLINSYRYLIRLDKTLRGSIASVPLSPVPCNELMLPFWVLSIIVSKHLTERTMVSTNAYTAWINDNQSLVSKVPGLKEFHSQWI